MSAQIGHVQDLRDTDPQRQAFRHAAAITTLQAFVSLALLNVS
jgi:hypothetical protein